MTKKKQRFQKARKLRQQGVPFALARKMANDLVNKFSLGYRKLDGVTFQDVTCGDTCQCLEYRLVHVQTEKGVLTFKERDLCLL